jgi:CheY-like chemotaxis protein
LRLLECWNHQTTLVENGRRALEILQNETFDIVLMDVQMAEMDGLTATKEFRKWEKGIRNSEGGRRNEIGNNSDLESNIQHPGSSIQHRVPIIAMTAHAVKGDRERCLQAGMDVYVSKPIDTDKLFEAIETLTRKVENSKTIAADSATVDKMLLLKAFDGDWSFLEEVVEVFLSDYPRLMDDLRRANTEGDCDLLMRSAHSLKGMLKNFQAESAAGVAYQIEKKAKTENCDDVRTKIEDLTDRITGVDKMLRDILVQQPAR